jgi:UDP-GlcNAc:undecaprenyl-phosphate GlcNAc-1-phosphate transferase
MHLTTAVLAPLYCAVVTLILCALALPICRWLNILDVPDVRKRHARPTPLVGGLALLLAAVPAVVAAAFSTARAEWSGHILAWVFAVSAMTLVGLADDRHTLSARDRLLVSFLVFGSAAVVDPLFGVRVLDFKHLGFQLGLWTGWFSVIFTVICGVGLVNAVNMADGKNGLVIGLCIGWLCILALRAPPPLTTLIVCLLATLSVLLVFNLTGRLFLGDGGAYGLATAIGLIAIATYNTPGSHAGRAVSADELMLLFAVPVLDSFRLSYVRLRQGRSPMSADRDHLHHHLQNALGWPMGLVVYLTLALLPAAAVLAAV